jgi:hypothetical protein
VAQYINPTADKNAEITAILLSAIICLPGPQILFQPPLLADIVKIKIGLSVTFFQYINPLTGEQLSNSGTKHENDHEDKKRVR